MAVVFSRRRWWRQPQGIVRLNTANDLLANVESVVSDLAVYGNRVPGDAMSLTGNPAILYSNFGAEPTKSSTYTPANYLTKPSLAGTGNWTIAGLFVIPSGSGAGSLVGTCEAPGSSSRDRQLLYENANWEGYIYDGSPKFADSGLAIAGDRMDAAVVTCNGATLWCYANASSGSIAVSNAGYDAYASPEFAIGNSASDAITFSSPLVLRTRAAWSAEQAARFIANPWSVFAPQRRAYFFVPTLGATVVRRPGLRVLGQARNRAGM